jgi:hypothetical protein
MKDITAGSSSAAGIFAGSPYRPRAYAALRIPVQQHCTHTCTHSTHVQLETAVGRETCDPPAGSLSPLARRRVQSGAREGALG